MPALFMFLTILSINLIGDVAGRSASTIRDAVG